MSGLIHIRSKQVITIIVTFMLLVTPALAGAARKAQKGHTTKQTKAKSAKKAKAKAAPVAQIPPSAASCFPLRFYFPIQ